MDWCGHTLQDCLLRREVIQIQMGERRSSNSALLPVVALKARRTRTRNDSLGPEIFSLSSVAHEFKTPLSVMLGCTQLLRDGRIGALNEKQQELLDIGRASCRERV